MVALERVGVARGGSSSSGSPPARSTASSDDIALEVTRPSPSSTVPLLASRSLTLSPCSRWTHTRTQAARANGHKKKQRSRAVRRNQYSCRIEEPELIMEQLQGKYT
ncbi:BAG family molecular chaperone regulator 1 [Triticum aestivum]|uniref:BAG family molecular chaperone regulator 1 n=1 Tax=Triticum aestivum TaxID=4565 RepID=UPI001D02B2FB|nr:BAG family molecular chaperone regulator 1-like [Triticum aestivum]